MSHRMATGSVPIVGLLLFSPSLADEPKAAKQAIVALRPTQSHLERRLVELERFLGLKREDQIPAKREQPRDPPDPKALEQKIVELEKVLDTLTKEVKNLRGDINKLGGPTIADRTILKVFRLKNAVAPKLEKTIQNLFQEMHGNFIRISSDQRTNSVIVYGEIVYMEMIESLIARLDEPVDEKGREDKNVKEKPGRVQESLKEIKDRIALAETEVQICKDRLAWSERMVKKGYMSDSQLQAEKLRLQNAELARSKAKRDLHDFPKEPEGQKDNLHD